MDWLQALILGIVQGLTEYLPVSSSGHLTIGSALFGVDGEANLTFNIAVHVATVLSTCCILWKEIVWIFKDLFAFKWNEGTKYALNIIVSMIPIGIVGVLLKDKVEAIFNPETSASIFGNSLFIVGCCLMLTALLLTFSYFAKPRQKEHITPWNAFVIGIAQACADMKDLIGGEAAAEGASTAIGTFPLIVGFLAAFVVGCMACKWMIDIVKKGKLIWFAIYCAVVSLLVIILPYLF